MAYYDFHIHSAFSEGKSSLEDIANRSKLLGYSGICFTMYYRNLQELEKLKVKVKNISKDFGVEIFLGFEARNSHELNKLTKMRREYDLLLARGSDLEFNRLAVETPEVDILTHPELGRNDSGLNHVMMKLAANNNVAIEINFREISLSFKGSRSLILKNISENVKLCKKYKTPLISCSGAISHWQIKDPKVMMSFATLLGLKLDEAKRTISDTPGNIIKMIKERKSKNWIMPGVKEI